MYPDKPLTNKLIYVPIEGYGIGQLRHIEILFFKLGYHWLEEDPGKSVIEFVYEMYDGKLLALTNVCCPSLIKENNITDPSQITERAVKEGYKTSLYHRPFTKNEPAASAYPEETLKHIDITSIDQLIQEVKRVKNVSR